MTTISIIINTIFVSLTLQLLSCRNSPKIQSSISESNSLTLVIIVDQFKGSYLSEHRFKWGINELKTKGILFDDAHHPHAVTTTCPGHATIATGHYPSTHGIVENHWLENGQRVYCVDDSTYKVAPSKMLAKTFGDILKEKFSNSKVYAVSGKDRGAVLMGGALANGAYWYDKKVGSFTTSAYYARDEKLAESLKTVSGDTYAGKVWDEISPSAKSPQSQQSRYNFFPHPLSSEKEKLYTDIYKTPFLDELTLDAALKILSTKKLGTNSNDILHVSFSALDIIGHHYGPGSGEVAAALEVLDPLISKLLRAARKQVGDDRIRVILTADHGVADLAEQSSFTRLTQDDLDCLKTQLTKAQSTTNINAFIGMIENGLYFRPVINQEMNDKLYQSLARLLPLCPNIERVWQLSTIAKTADGESALGLKYSYSYFPSRSPQILLQLKEQFVPTPSGTTHGSPYEYDTHVPLIIMAPGLRPQIVTRGVTTVDIAPTFLHWFHLGDRYHGPGENLLNFEP